MFYSWMFLQGIKLLFSLSSNFSVCIFPSVSASLHWSPPPSLSSPLPLHLYHLSLYLSLPLHLHLSVSSSLSLPPTCLSLSPSSHSIFLPSSTSLSISLSSLFSLLHLSPSLSVCLSVCLCACLSAPTPEVPEYSFDGHSHVHYQLPSPLPARRTWFQVLVRTRKHSSTILTLVSKEQTEYIRVEVNFMCAWCDTYKTHISREFWPVSSITFGTHLIRWQLLLLIMFSRLDETERERRWIITMYEKPTAVCPYDSSVSVRHTTFNYLLHSSCLHF